MYSRATLVCVAMLFVSACSLLDISTTYSYRQDDRPIALELLEKIEQGSHTQRWLLDHLGAPSDRLHDPQGREQWIYRVEQRERKRVRLLLLFSWRATDIQERQVGMIFHQDRIAKVWRNYVSSSDLPGSIQGQEHVYPHIKRYLHREGDKVYWMSEQELAQYQREQRAKASYSASH